MAKPSIDDCAGIQSSISQLQRARIAARACSPAHLSRQIVEGWRFISLNDPPSWLHRTCILVVLVYMIALIFDALPPLGPWRLNHLDALLFGLMFGWLLVWLAVLVVGWAIANTVLAVTRLVTFPLVLTLMLLHRLITGWVLLPRFLDMLSTWTREDDAMRLFVQVLMKANTEQVQTLERARSDQITSKLIEQHHVDFLGCLPVEAWFRLVTPELSPAAATILFRHNLRADAEGKPVLEALVAGNWFAKSECGQLLVQQLAAMPEHKLAGILDRVAELDRSFAQHSLLHILRSAQRLGDRSAIRCFQGALGLVSLQTCEAALVHAEIS